jgi:hypothetical protein
MNARLATASCAATFCPIVELRQYTLHPGKRNILIELFEREFIETQEAAGMTLIGQFRDLDDPDRFVWLRGFADMPSRALALAAFYGGPAWQTHRDVANATMIDSDNVLLLRPLDVPAGFISDPGNRPSPGSHDRDEELVWSSHSGIARGQPSTVSRTFLRRNSRRCLPNALLRSLPASSRNTARTVFQRCRSARVSMRSWVWRVLRTIRPTHVMSPR